MGGIKLRKKWHESPTVEWNQCKTCSNFVPDDDGKGGGWCPVPKVKRDGTYENTDGKRVSKAHKACSEYSEIDNVLCTMTNKDLFLVVFPNAELDTWGYPKSCALHMGLVKTCYGKCKDCWDKISPSKYQNKEMVNIIIKQMKGD